MKKLVLATAIIAIIFAFSYAAFGFPTHEYKIDKHKIISTTYDPALKNPVTKIKWDYWVSRNGNRITGFEWRTPGGVECLFWNTPDNPNQWSGSVTVGRGPMREFDQEEISGLLRLMPELNRIAKQYKEFFAVFYYPMIDAVSILGKSNEEITITIETATKILQAIQSIPGDLSKLDSWMELNITQKELIEALDELNQVQEDLIWTWEAILETIDNIQENLQVEEEPEAQKPEPTEPVQPEITYGSPISPEEVKNTWHKITVEQQDLAWTPYGPAMMVEFYYYNTTDKNQNLMLCDIIVGAWQMEGWNPRLTRYGFQDKDGKITVYEWDVNTNSFVLDTELETEQRWKDDFERVLEENEIPGHEPQIKEMKDEEGNVISSGC